MAFREKREQYSQFSNKTDGDIIDMPYILIGNLQRDPFMGPTTWKLLDQLSRPTHISRKIVV
jgi:hypothetical protein